MNEKNRIQRFKEQRNMKDAMEFSIEVAGQPITCTIVPMGDDVALAVYGGERPHIGCTVLAVPRESLTGTGRSATMSTLNRMGHKDDVVATAVAQQVAARLDCAVSCSCGIHIDRASPQLIEAIAGAPDCIAERVCELMRATRR
jgi:hypothetical protein